MWNKADVGEFRNYLHESFDENSERIDELQVEIDELLTDQARINNLLRKSDDELLDYLQYCRKTINDIFQKYGVKSELHDEYCLPSGTEGYEVLAVFETNNIEYVFFAESQKE